MKSGAYRSEEILNQLDNEVAKLIRGGMRLACTNQPIHGCDIHKESVDAIAAAYERMGGEVGEFYAGKLRRGELVPVTPKSQASDKYWSPGELYFTS